jgi:hypothetical protein
MKNTNARFFFMLSLSLIMLLSFSACGAPAAEAPKGEAPVAEEAPAAEEVSATEAPAAEAPAADAPAAVDMVAKFTFTNTGSVEICELYLSPVDTENWGPDQLSSKTIPAGEKFVLANIPAGKYDAKVVGCNNAGEQVVQLEIKN